MALVGIFSRARMGEEELKMGCGGAIVKYYLVSKALFTAPVKMKMKFLVFWG